MSTTNRHGRYFLAPIAIAIFLFLYLPIVVLVIFSFQESRVLAWPIDDWSLGWYRKLFANSEILDALGNSLIVATTCVAFTTIIGVLLALAIRSFPARVQRILEHTFLLPLIIPQIITGLALLIVFNRSGINLSLITVIVGQSVVWTPIVVTQVYARLRRLDASLEQASRDLGANALQTFWLVTLPNIRTALVGSSLLVFTLSFDELPVTFFLTGGENTLPMHIWSMLRIGITPEINAIATLTVGASIILILLGVRTLANDTKKGAGNE